jgi:hypothetical protein
LRKAEPAAARGEPEDRFGLFRRCSVLLLQLLYNAGELLASAGADAVRASRAYAAAETETTAVGSSTISIVSVVRAVSSFIKDRIEEDWKKKDGRWI